MIETERLIIKPLTHKQLLTLEEELNLKSISRTISTELKDALEHDKSNAASYLVLLKNGFIKIGETDLLLKWQLILNKQGEFYI